MRRLLSPSALLAWSACVVLIIAPLFQQGLFTDGCLYRTVAFNFSQNPSNFWHMKFTDINMPQFFEQPPLFFAMYGVWLKGFGTSFLSEKLFTLMLFVLFLIVLYNLSRLLLKPALPFFYVLLFLLLLVQVWCWTFANQVIETAVVPLSALGVYVFIAWQKSPKHFYATLLAAFGFTFISYALFLTKGFQSVFIACVPLVAFILFPNRKQNLLFCAVAYLSLAALLVYTLFIHNGGSYWFNTYMHKRLLASLNQVGATTQSHFDIIFRLFTELIGPIVLLVVLSLFLAKKWQYPLSLQFKRFRKNRYALLFLITALVGSLPFAITLEQRGFYLSPSFLFFIVGGVLAFKPQFILGLTLIQKVDTNKVAQYFSYMLVIGALVYWCYSPNFYRRDERLYKEVNILLSFLPQGDTLSIHALTWNDIALQSVLYQKQKISLECDTTHRYYLHDKANHAPIPLGFTKITTHTQQLELYYNTTRFLP